MPTRFTSSPRMIGREDAPGAKLDPVMPGLENRRSPIVLAGVRRSSSFGTTVTVANWSVTMGSTPACGSAGAGGGEAAGGAAACARGAAGAGAGRRTIGLGAVTRISGSWVCARVALTSTNWMRAEALTISDRAKEVLMPSLAAILQCYIVSVIL